MPARSASAYVVPTAGRTLEATEVRDFLARQLPEFMVPSAFIGMTELPLNSNGKLDRAALPMPSPENALGVASFRAPQSPIEIQVAAILAELLHVEKVSLDDNFFLLGGHSLMGAQLILRVRQRFGADLT